jgi:hypothetical protein
MLVLRRYGWVSIAPALAAFALGLPRIARGQGGVVGSVVGNVLDQSGQPLKGVKVVARSETQIGGPKTTYTNDEGFFRFPGLQPGVFEVTAAASGLKSVHQKGVNVGVNAAAEVVLIMEVETAQEEVKVVEKAPMVSTTSATVKEVYDEDFIDNLPLDVRTAVEDFVSHNVPGTVPGADDRQTRIRGGNVEQNAFLVDGFFMNNQKTTYKSLSAMEVQTAGYGPDGAATPGGLVTMVTKSGSNKLELDVNGFHEDTRLRFMRDPSDTEALSTVTYINPNLSGPLIKDRLWFYVNVEGRSQLRDRDPDPTGFFPAPPRRSYLSVRGTTKLTWQATPRNKIQSFSLLNRDSSRNRLDGLHVSRDAQQMLDHLDYLSGLTWESVLTDSLFFKTQAGFTRFWEENAPERCRREPVECDHIAPIVQSYPQTINLQNYDRHLQRVERAFELVSTLEWFGHTRRAGDHDVKLVSRYYRRTDEIAESTPGDRLLRWNGLAPERETVYYANDPRFDTERFGWRITSTAGHRWVTSLQDAMRLTRHFTLNLGVAIVTTASENSKGESVTGATAFTPHVAAAWDVTRDGRTALRASFNNYVDPDVGRLARHSLGSRVSRECRWSEANQAFDADCRYAGGAAGRTFGLPCGPQGYDENGRECREKLRIPRTWEYTLGAERELVPGVSLGSDLVYRDYRYPYSTKETNRIWNASGTALDVNGRFRNGRTETIDDLETPAEARRKYVGVTTSAHKREGTFKINASYTWSHLYGNVHNTENNAWGDIPPRDLYLWGDLPDDSRHNIKLTLTKQWTKWLSTGVSYRYYSGRPYSRRYRNTETGGYDDYRARVGVNPGGNVNDPGDDRPLRLPDLQQLNLQARTNLKPLLGTNLELYADVMNVLALRTTTSVVQDDGPRFEQAASRMNPLTVRLGFRFKY